MLPILGVIGNRLVPAQAIALGQDIDDADALVERLQLVNQGFTVFLRVGPHAEDRYLVDQLNLFELAAMLEQGERR